MASTKSTSRSGQRRSSSPNGNSSAAKARAKPKAKAKSSASRSTSRSGAKAKKTSQSGPKARSGSSGGSRQGQQAATGQNGIVGTIKDAAGKAKGPAVAVGAAAAGIAGGVVLKRRMRRKTVLGVPLPRSLANGHLTDLDLKSVAKSVGEASQRFATASKSVSKDIERAGDQAERIGKILS